MKKTMKKILAFVLIASLVWIPNMSFAEVSSLPEPTNPMSVDYLDANAQAKLHDIKWIRVDDAGKDITDEVPSLDKPFSIVVGFNLYTHKDDPHKIKKGDTATITLLKGAKIEQSSNFDVEVVGRNATIGQATLMPSGDDTVVKIDFNGADDIFNAQTTDESPLKVKFSVRTKMEQYEEFKTTNIKKFALVGKTYYFDGNIITDKEDTFKINKAGKYDGNKTIIWTVELEKYGKNFDNCKFEDDLTNVGTYVDGSFKINGKEVTSTNNLSINDKKIEYSFPNGIIGKQTVEFATEIQKEKFDKKINGGQSKFDVKNIAKVIDADKNEKEAKATVPVELNWISKKCDKKFTKWNEVDETELLWTITANEKGHKLENVIIRDVLPRGVEFKKTNDKLIAKLTVGNEPEKDVEMLEEHTNTIIEGKSRTVYKADIGNVDKKIVLKVPTKMTRVALTEEYGKDTPKVITENIKLKNRARIHWTGMGEEPKKQGDVMDIPAFQADAEHEVEKPDFDKLIKKECIDGKAEKGKTEKGITWGSAQKNGLQWIITVNSDNSNLKNVKIEEILPQGLKIKKNKDGNPVVWVKEDFNGKPYEIFTQGTETEVNLKGDRFEYKLDELNKTLTIGVWAEPDEKALAALNNGKFDQRTFVLTNQAAITAEGISRTEARAKYNLYTEVIGKSGKDAAGNITTDWNNVEGKTIIWTIKINGGKHNLKDVYVLECMPDFLKVETNSDNKPIGTLKIGNKESTVVLHEIAPKDLNTDFRQKENERNDLKGENLANKKIYGIYVPNWEGKGFPLNNITPEQPQLGDQTAFLTIKTEIDVAKITEDIAKDKKIRNLAEIHYRKIRTPGQGGDAPWFAEKNSGSYTIKKPTPEEVVDPELTKVGKYDFGKNAITWTLNVKQPAKAKLANYKLYDFFPTISGITSAEGLKVDDQGMGTPTNEILKKACEKDNALQKIDVNSFNPGASGLTMKVYPVKNKAGEQVGDLVEVSGFKDEASNAEKNYKFSYVAVPKEIKDNYKNTAVLINDSKEISASAEVGRTLENNPDKPKEEVKQYILKTMLSSANVAAFDATSGDPTAEIANNIERDSAKDKTLSYSYSDNAIIYRLVVNQGGDENIKATQGDIEISDKLPEGWVFDKFKNGKDYIVFKAKGSSEEVEGNPVDPKTLNLSKNGDFIGKNSVYFTVKENLPRMVIFLKAKPTEETVKKYISDKKFTENVENTVTLKGKKTNTELKSSISDKVFFKKVLDKKSGDIKKDDINTECNWTIDYRPSIFAENLQKVVIHDTLGRGVDVKLNPEGLPDISSKANYDLVECTINDKGELVEGDSVAIAQDKITYNKDTRKLSLELPDVSKNYRFKYKTSIYGVQAVVNIAEIEGNGVQIDRIVKMYMVAGGQGYASLPDHISVIKKWDGDSKFKEFHEKFDKIKAILVENGKLSDKFTELAKVGNEIKGVITNIKWASDEDGTIDYTLKEVISRNDKEVTDKDYELALEKKSINEFVMVNKQKTIDVLVEKNWQDKDGKGLNGDALQLPSSIKVVLTKTVGEKTEDVQELVLNKPNWRVTIEKLPLMDYSGNEPQEIKYGVREINVSGYTGAIAGDQTKGFVITNKQSQVTPPPTIPTYPPGRKPNPNDPKSPPKITVIDENGVPLGNYKKQQKPDGTYEYVLMDEDVPLAGVLPKTGEDYAYAFYIAGLVFIIAGLSLVRRRKNTVKSK